MGELLSDLLEFLWAVVSYWQAYVTGGVIAAAMFLYERWIGKSLSLRIVLLGAVAFLIVAFFMAWRDQHLAVNKANGQIAELRKQLDDLTKPQLSIHIAQVMTGQFDPEKGKTIFLVYATVKNLGAPSIAKAYEMAVIRPNGQVSLVPPKVVSLNTIGLHLGPDNSTEAILHKEDYLFLKTASNPIIKGQEIPGFITFVADFPPDAPSLLGSTVVLSCVDINENRVESNRWIMTTMTQDPNQFLYLPGLQMPEMRKIKPHDHAKKRG